MFCGKLAATGKVKDGSDPIEEVDPKIKANSKYITFPTLSYLASTIPFPLVMLDNAGVHACQSAPGSPGSVENLSLVTAPSLIAAVVTELAGKGAFNRSPRVILFVIEPDTSTIAKASEFSAVVSELNWVIFGMGLSSLPYYVFTLIIQRVLLHYSIACVSIKT